MKSLGVSYCYVKMPWCGCMEYRLEYITFYVQKHIALLALCSGAPLVRHGRLGASAFVRLAYCCNMYFEVGLLYANWKIMHIYENQFHAIINAWSLATQRGVIYNGHHWFKWRLLGWRHKGCYLNQYWHIISEFLWFSTEGNNAGMIKIVIIRTYCKITH